MTSNQRYFTFCSFILIISFLSSATATFCSNLTSTDDKDTPCFLESSTFNPARLRSSSNSLILPCHVARSKRSTVEWWYQDFQKKVHIKIYPVYPAVRPTVLRFLTRTPSSSVAANETDIIDVSVLLRNVDVDDSGIYQCVVRPWSETPVSRIDETLPEDDPTVSTLSYHVELSGPRVCHSNFDLSPCFQETRTSSPTVVHAYQSAFLQCVVQNKNLSVFWVIGNETGNSAVIIDYLTVNEHNGDRLRRVFPLSPFDYSIELMINRETYERSYSCVVDRQGDYEATLFTYIVRSIDVEKVVNKTVETTKNATTMNTTGNQKASSKLQMIISHDTLTREQIEQLRQKSGHEHGEVKTDNLEHDDENTETDAEADTDTHADEDDEDEEDTASESDVRKSASDHS